MGDVRFDRAWAEVAAQKETPHSLSRFLSEASDSLLVSALASDAARAHPVERNVLATELLNRIERATGQRLDLDAAVAHEGILESVLQSRELAYAARRCILESRSRTRRSHAMTEEAGAQSAGHDTSSSDGASAEGAKEGDPFHLRDGEGRTRR